MKRKPLVTKSRRPVTNEARPLGALDTSSLKVVKKAVDTSVMLDIPSSPVDSTAVPPSSGTVLQTQEQTITMSDITLTKDPKARRTTSIVYLANGTMRGSVRISKTAFDGEAPDTVVLTSDKFAAPRVARAKMTPEERKAARAAKPKPTLAEKIAKREAALAKLKAQLDSATM